MHPNSRMSPFSPSVWIYPSPSSDTAPQGIENLTTLSDHKALDFGSKYGFVIEELRLLSRGVIVIDKDDVIRYIQYVPNVEDAPDFDSALAAVKALS